MWISRKTYAELIEKLAEQKRNIKDKGIRIGKLEHLLEAKEAECKELKQRVLRAYQMYEVGIGLLNFEICSYTITALSPKDAEEMAKYLFLKENKNYTKKDIACIFVSYPRGGEI